jgi:GNAT superfamily N-acetyltransferase
VSDDFKIDRFNSSMQDAFRTLVLDGMAEHWGSVDVSLNTDLDDVATHYVNDLVLVALDGAQIVGTGILLIRTAHGEVVRMAAHRDYRRRGIAKKLLAALLGLAPEYGVGHIVVETNAEWSVARALYEGSGFTLTHIAAGRFGREAFYGLET